MGNQNLEMKFILDDIRDKTSVLLGLTGAGKSSFINAITRKNNCEVGHTQKSCTRKINQSDINYDGYNFYFVDTPGLDDVTGDKKNIIQLDDVKVKYPRINAFIICLKLDDLRFSSSLKMSFQKFMELFPAKTFWQHVLIVRTHSIQSKKLKKMKDNAKGELLNGIKNDKDLLKIMENNGIDVPSNLEEFYVDSEEDPEDGFDKETLEEFEKIFDSLKNKYPIYKDVKEEIKEFVNEEKEENTSFIHIKTEKHIFFKDFDGKEHNAIQIIGDEKYNLDGIRPILTETKRDQGDTPRGSWFCWKYQFNTRYYLVKIYEIGNKRKRVECELETRWEYKNEEAEEDGETYRKKLDEKHNSKNCCEC